MTLGKSFWGASCLTRQPDPRFVFVCLPRFLPVDITATNALCLSLAVAYGALPFRALPGCPRSAIFAETSPTLGRAHGVVVCFGYRHVILSCSTPQVRRLNVAVLAFVVFSVVLSSFDMLSFSGTTTLLY